MFLSVPRKQKSYYPTMVPQLLFAPFTNKFPRYHKPELPRRIDLTLNGLECLQIIFDGCMKSSAMEREPSVNLRAFQVAVTNSNLLAEILDERASMDINNQICSLDRSDAHNTYVTWLQLKKLLTDYTLLSLPIEPEPCLQFRLFQEKLVSMGLEIERSASDGFTYENESSSSASNLNQIRMTLEEKNKTARNFGTEDHSAISGRVDTLMHVESDEERLVGYRFVPIRPVEHSAVRNVFRGPASDEEIIMKFNIPITSNKLICLKPSTWLNDEVINFYMCMLKERDTSLCEKDATRIPSYFFNSFFMFTLMIRDGKYDYNSVRRWTKKIDIFALDKVFFPVNLSNTHWTLLVVYITRKEIHYYDSMSGSGTKYLEGMKRWLQDEYRDKKKEELNVENWILKDKEKNVPQQRNGVDCGMFSIICADFLSDNLPLSYEQKDMPAFREKVAAAILSGKLDYPL